MPTESILDSKILIVDDQAGVRESMKMVLDNLYQVLTAEDGIKCLDITQQNKIGLIMLDLTMPKMQGLEVLQHIKEIDYSIPVIIITGVRSHQSAIDALRMGATDFILKPFDATYLRHMVKETLKQAELEKDETEREKIKASLLPLEEISRDEYFHILDALHKTLEAKEPKVKGHAVNVADYVVSIARQLGYAEKTTRILKNTTTSSYF